MDAKGFLTVLRNLFVATMIVKEMASGVREFRYRSMNDRGRLRVPQRHGRANGAVAKW